MLIHHANKGRIKIIEIGYKQIKKYAINTALDAWPDGKENWSGSTVANMSGVFEAGLRLLTYALITATNRMSRSKPEK